MRVGIAPDFILAPCGAVGGVASGGWRAVGILVMIVVVLGVMGFGYGVWACRHMEHLESHLAGNGESPLCQVPKSGI